MGKFSAEQSCREFYMRLSTLRLMEAFAVTQESVHTLRCLRLFWALLVWAKIRLITWKCQVAMIKSTLLIFCLPRCRSLCPAAVHGPFVAHAVCYWVVPLSTVQVSDRRLTILVRPRCRFVRNWFELMKRCFHSFIYSRRLIRLYCIVNLAPFAGACTQFQGIDYGFGPAPYS